MGSGAIGSVTGGFLAMAGHKVSLVGRKPHMDAITRDGLQIEGIWGNHLIQNLECVTALSAIEVPPPDWVFLTTKSYDTPAAVQALRPLVGDETLVCSYQNGLGNAEIIAQAFGWERCVGARVIFGVWLPRNGNAEVTVIANPTALGTYDKATPKERVRDMARTLEAAGMPTVYTDLIGAVLWAKVAYNCALNPMSALLDVPYGALAESEDTRSVIQDVIQELYAVAAAMDKPLEPQTPEAYLEHFFQKLIPPTAGHFASMREDFRRKRRTEIDALNGAICKYGMDRGIDTPVNATLTRLVRAYEKNYRSRAGTATEERTENN